MVEKITKDKLDNQDVLDIIAVVSQNNDPIYVPCRTLRNIESASGVKWHGHILKGKNENEVGIYKNKKIMSI